MVPVSGENLSSLSNVFGVQLFQVAIHFLICRNTRFGSAVTEGPPSKQPVCDQHVNCIAKTGTDVFLPNLRNHLFKTPKNAKFVR